MTARHSAIHLAQQIVDALALADAPLRGLQLARAVGLPYTMADRRKSLNNIQSVMPIACYLAAQQMPGKGLTITKEGEFHVYQITDRRITRIRSELPRLRKGRTAIERASHVLPLNTLQRATMENTLDDLTAVIDSLADQLNQ